MKLGLLLSLLMPGLDVLHADVISDLRPRIRQEAEKRNVDPVLMEAILRHESAHGTSKAARTKNNLAGIKAGYRLKRYESKDDSVAHLATVLERYKDRGISTPQQLSRCYCATSPGQWERYVNMYMQFIRKGKYGLPAPEPEEKAEGSLFSQNAPSVKAMGTRGKISKQDPPGPRQARAPHCRTRPISRRTAQMIGIADTNTHKTSALPSRVMSGMISSSVSE